MTKIYLLSVFCFLSLTTIAQIKKNSILLGGDISYSRNKGEGLNHESKVNSGFLGISIGKAFRQNSVIGIRLSTSHNLQSNYVTGNDSIKFINNQYGAGLFYREYKQLGKDLYLFGNTEVAYRMSNDKTDYQSGNKDQERKSKGATIGLTPGLSYQLFKKLQIELTIPSLISISYFTSKYEDQRFPGTVSKEKSFALSSNLFGNSTLGNLGLGFRFLL